MLARLAGTELPVERRVNLVHAAPHLTDELFAQSPRIEAGGYGLRHTRPPRPERLDRRPLVAHRAAMVKDPNLP